MLKIRLALAVLRAFVLLIGNPKRTQEILRLTDRMHELGLYDPVIEKLKSDRGVAALFKERYARGRLDMESLSRLPDGTLGREFARFAHKNGIDPNYFHRESLKIIDDHDYYEVRLRETHDIWHVVLGFDTTEPGELAVQGFKMAQFAPPLAAFLVGGIFWRVLFHHPTKAPEYGEAFARGFLKGRQCPQFFAEKWENAWAEELESVRARLKVTV